jgi:hypothetical protein
MVPAASLLLFWIAPSSWCPTTVGVYTQLDGDLRRTLVDFVQVRRKGWSPLPLAGKPPCWLQRTGGRALKKEIFRRLPRWPTSTRAWCPPGGGKQSDLGREGGEQYLESGI